MFRKILDNQKVEVNREEMIALINFETAVNWIIRGTKEVEGKTPAEVLDLLEKSKDIPF